MILKKWESLPKELKNDETKIYYQILKKKKLQLILKRIFDIVISSMLIILLMPVILIIAILIKIDSKGPIFYRQKRVTTYGKVFKICKFRTMIQNADKIGTLITVGEDNRITRIGKRIRKLRIDEIPQLFNIFIGDMSFVGTRPEVEKYVNQYTDEMKATLLMPAGLTSIASIQYKDEDNIMEKYVSTGETVDYVYMQRVLPEKMKWNLEYERSFNILKDFKSCIDTVIKIFN